MEINIYQVDAFSDTSFGGNPAGVVPNARFLTENQMQNIAKEMNLSETAFVMPLDEDSKWISHLPTEQGKEITDYYDTQINYGESFSTKSKKPANEAKSSRWNMYKSSIFMPIVDTKIATYQSNNELVPTSNYRDILNQAIAKRNQNAIKTNF